MTNDMLEDRQEAVDTLRVLLKEANRLIFERRYSTSEVYRRDCDEVLDRIEDKIFAIRADFPDIVLSECD